MLTAWHLGVACSPHTSHTCQAAGHHMCALYPIHVCQAPTLPAG